MKNSSKPVLSCGQAATTDISVIADPFQRHLVAQILQGAAAFLPPYPARPGAPGHG